jgi:hypothetical protein
VAIGEGREVGCPTEITGQNIVIDLIVKLLEAIREAFVVAGRNRMRPDNHKEGSYR